MKSIGRLLTLLLGGSTSAAQTASVIVGVSDGNHDALRVEDGRFVGTLAQRCQCALEVAVGRCRSWATAFPRSAIINNPQENIGKKGQA